MNPQRIYEDLGQHTRLLFGLGIPIVNGIAIRARAAPAASLFCVYKVLARHFKWRDN